ncbi:MAG: DUF4124 domain-containing protein, partial [Betaproteobacteria bacterium]|nr:DUF4124 domain-containing protein [Betaproteobacteria bacterium]
MRFSRASGCRLRLGVLAAVVWCLAPAGAWGDIYAWTDEKGSTVFSNVRPGESATADNFRVVAEEEKPAAKSPPPQGAGEAVQPEAMRREKALTERIENVERQLQALQYRTEQNQALLDRTQRYMAELNQVQQYQAQLPPPPPGYYGGYSPVYYYPPPPVYLYPAVPAFSVVAFPKRLLVRRPIVTTRVFVPHRGVSPRVL